MAAPATATAKNTKAMGMSAVKGKKVAKKGKKNPFMAMLGM